MHCALINSVTAILWVEKMAHFVIVVHETWTNDNNLCEIEFFANFSDKLVDAVTKMDSVCHKLKE